MKPIIILAIVFVASIYLSTIQGSQDDFNKAIDSFIKKRDRTKLPTNKTVDRSKCRSNMRKTSDQVNNKDSFKRIKIIPDTKKIITPSPH